MKAKIFLSLLFVAFYSYSQNPPLGSPIPIKGGLDASILSGANVYKAGTWGETSTNFTRIDYATIRLPNLSPKAKGTIYSFKDYNNKGFLVSDKKVFKLDNLNFNLLNNTIESKVSKDSVYVFDLQNVDYAIISGKKFKSQWINDGNRIVEVIHEGKSFSLVKNYVIDIRAKDPSSDPLMVKKEKNATFVRSTDYWVLKNDEFEKISLKKKTVLSLLNDKIDLIKKYVKTNKLSYRKAKDVKKIFLYYESV